MAPGNSFGTCHEKAKGQDRKKKKLTRGIDEYII